MTADSDDDVVRVGSGTPVQAALWNQALADAGIAGRVVGQNLTAGVGPALTEGAAEVWVRRADAGRAAAVLAGLERPTGGR